MYEYIEEFTNEKTVETPNIDSNDSTIIADEEDIFKTIDVVFETHKITPPSTSPPSPDIEVPNVTDKPCTINQKADDEILKLLRGIVTDVQEIKIDILHLKNSLGSTKVQLEEKIHNVETVATTIVEVLKKRKPPSPNIEQSTPTPAAVRTPPVPFLSPISNADQEPTTSFADLLSSSIILDDTLRQPSNLVPTNSHQETVERAKPKRKINACSTFIRQQLQSHYEEEELAKGSLSGGKRKWKDAVTEREPLSPHRLGKIIQSARKRFSKEDIDSLNLSDLVNSKCRQVRFKLEKRFQNIE